MKKKRILPLAALILALLSLAVSILALASVPEDQTHLIDDLYRQIAQLEGQIDDLSARLDQQQTAVTLRDWSLTATPWADSTGADITLTATPSAYSPDQSAALTVFLDGAQVTSEACVWDGVRLTATVSLSADDGYSYFLQLSSGSDALTLPLTTADNPLEEIPVYLASSLSAYCNLVVNDWVLEEGVLSLADAYAQVQLPRISAGADTRIESALLVLRRNGADVVRMPITLEPSEISGSFDAAVTGFDLPVGTLSDGDTLELYLEVTLTGGRNLSTFGISWFQSDGTLTSSVG